MASSGGGSADLQPGDACYVVLVEDVVKIPLQAILVEPGVTSSIIAVPAGLGLPAEGAADLKMLQEDLELGKAPSHLVKSNLDSNVAVSFHRVEPAALSNVPSAKHKYMVFKDKNDKPCIPTLKTLRAALYAMEPEPNSAGTDTEEDEVSMLKLQLEEMKKALEQLRVSPPQTQAASSGAVSVQKAARSTVSFLEGLAQEDEDEEVRDDDDEDEPLMAALKKLSKDGFGGGAAGQANIGQSPAGSRTPGVVPAGVDVNMMVQMQLLKEIQKMQKQSGGLGSEGGPLDGLRVLKTLGNLRALRDNMKEKPTRVVREYTQEWEETLGARGRPWSWRDVARHVNWSKYRSMHRVYVMLGGVKQPMVKKYALAEAQLVQNMKSIHQFALDGSWKVAWPVTYLPDPIDKPRRGAREEELEAVLAYLMTQEDIQKRAKALGTGDTQDAMSDDGNGEDTSRGGNKLKKQKKNTKQEDEKTQG